MTKASANILGIKDYIGASLHHPHAHQEIQACVPGGRQQQAALLERSVARARQLVRIGAAPQWLGGVADRVAQRRVSEDPWSAWVEPLYRMCLGADWPISVERSGEQVTLRLASPYAKANAFVARLAMELVAPDESAAGEPDAWRKRFAALAAALPRRDLLALHASLHRAGVPFRYGGEMTIVGWGARQKQLAGSGDPERLAESLAAHAFRIPVFTVTGSIGKTTTVRLLAQSLAATGLRLGVADSGGTTVDGKLIKAGDSIGGEAVRSLLLNPAIDAAVLEIGRGGLLRKGVPYDRSDVAILLNVGSAHLGYEGVTTLDGLADIKALTLIAATTRILNRDDAQCRRLASRFAPDSVVWFSVGEDEEALGRLAEECAGALGIGRRSGTPAELLVRRPGEAAMRISLDGVAPFHGSLGEKTLEQLLAVVGAVLFGPLGVNGLPQVLRGLRLDSGNHAFRSSLYRRGQTVFLLDKASNAEACALLGKNIDEICRREGIERRIGVFSRSAAFPPNIHGESCERLYGHIDEFLFHDRPETFRKPNALPGVTPGSIPAGMADKIGTLNAEEGRDKPFAVFPDWPEVEAELRKRLALTDDKMLVVVIQPSTNDSALNDRIVAFAERG